MIALRSTARSLAATPAAHFGLYYYAAVVRLIQCAARVEGSRAGAFSRFPFLEGYWDELAASGLAELTTEDGTAGWESAWFDWEATAREHLPLRALREETGLGHTSLVLLFSLGLPDEDARFGLVFEHLQGVPGQLRPTLGLATTWWRGDEDPDDAKVALRRLVDLGLVNAPNPAAPRGEWTLQLPPVIWDALAGRMPEGTQTWLRLHACSALPTLADLILADEPRRVVEAIPGLLGTGDGDAVVVRGPHHNGRRAVASAIWTSSNRPHRGTR